MRKETDPPDPRSGLREVAPGVSFLPLRTPTLPPATHTNCVFLGGGGDGDVVVVDPGSPWDDERARLGAIVDGLASARRRVREIWLSHHHLDHVEAAGWLADRVGAPIVAHERTARLVVPLPVARVVSDGEVLAVGGLALDVLHTPGHASGHLCLLDRASRTLIAGDMVAATGTVVVDPPDGDMGDYLASLERLRALAPRALLPAHGDVVPEAVPKLDEYVRHRLWREGRIVDLLGRGPATVAELIPGVYSDVASSLFPLAERSLLAHLEKLVREGRVARVGDRYRLRAARPGQ